jgi:hypothetical protein
MIQCRKRNMRVTSPHLRCKVILCISAPNQTRSRSAPAHEEQMNQTHDAAHGNQALTGHSHAGWPSHPELRNQTRPKCPGVKSLTWPRDSFPDKTSRPSFNAARRTATYDGTYQLSGTVAPFPSLCAPTLVTIKGRGGQTL